MSDGADNRQRAVKVTITGVELASLEGSYFDSKRQADRLHTETNSGQGGDLDDLAGLAVSLGYMTAYANALYLLTGSPTWKERYDQAAMARGRASATVSSQYRAMVRQAEELVRQVEELGVKLGTFLTEQAATAGNF